MITIPIDSNTSSTVTDGQGLYSFPKLPVARYDITFHIEGFKPQKRTGIQVDADSALQINVRLAEAHHNLGDVFSAETPHALHS